MDILPKLPILSYCSSGNNFNFHHFSQKNVAYFFMVIRVNRMKLEYIIFLMVSFLFNEHLIAEVMMSKGFTNGGHGYHETWYLGSNEQEFKYHKYRGGTVDDGLFVAIPDGGPYEGYSYYEITHPRTGFIDGGPAYLPKNPGDLPVSDFYMIANGYGFDQKDGFFKILPASLFGPQSEDLYLKMLFGLPSELPDGGIIPIGSKFFFWISGGGHFSLDAAVFEKIPLQQKAQENEAEKEQTATETLEEVVAAAHEIIEELVVEINDVVDPLKDIDIEEVLVDAVLEEFVNTQETVYWAPSNIYLEEFEDLIDGIETVDTEKSYTEL